MNTVRDIAIESCEQMKKQFIKKLVIDEKTYNELKELIEQECNMNNNCSMKGIEELCFLYKEILTDLFLSNKKRRN